MEISKEELVKSIKLLIKNGDIWAYCPKCSIPLSLKEYNKSNCGTCGKISADEVNFLSHGEHGKN